MMIYLQQMFWSGVNEFVHRYSNKGETYTTLEDTLTGKILSCFDKKVDKN